MNEAAYRAYLACLNERRFDDLDVFVHETITYNGAPMTRTQYAELIAGDVAAIPDLSFVVDELVVQDERVFARLWFDCRPQGRWQDMDADGRRVTFAEHVLYRFAQGRIAEVWSLIDIESVRRQLASPAE